MKFALNGVGERGEWEWGSERRLTTAATERNGGVAADVSPRWMALANGVSGSGEVSVVSRRRLRNEDVAADVKSAPNGIGEWNERERSSERRLHDGGYGTRK